ncbi:hypothetical protein [Companilactobacillus halodurans]|uniref:Uncharacterized protein n=1 Tax=Companilactobacillus halodurans TaxID=2584183 RepID=A0A5P0ZPG4_9LACO|nr:hypothetical protein [Companilactobacillus halodurans]MQS76098.1 hypothetical protein [Companilactobacillus halodurans]MQS96533.1 hypothetical protein [Companilactobacillus halodurans]
MDIKELDLVTREIEDFSGLEHIGNGMNKDIEDYFNFFMTWIDWNNVLDVINNYKDINMNLHYVTAHDFLVWLLHYGDVYDNLLRQCLSHDPLLDYKKVARQLYQLRQNHPKYSFTVALSSRMKSKKFLSDNDLDRFIPLLAKIPNNRKLSKKEITQSNLGDNLYEALYSLSNFAVQRVARNSF